MTSEDETWAQTLITVTPEDDATLREISDTVKLSSTSETSLVLDADNIVYRRSFTHRQFLDPQESEDEFVEAIKPLEEIREEEQTPKQDAENQTYLQGTPIIHISVEYRDEASQTMYMSSPCPPLKYFRDIMTSMNESLMPMLMVNNATITILGFDPVTIEDIVMQQLATHITEEELEDFELELTDEDEAEMEAVQILHFIIARACWIVDPATHKEGGMVDKETQTRIRFNYHTNTLTSDRDTQTELTCEPKKSNTTLLSDYLETKNMILNFLEDCLSEGLETGIVVEDIMNEIVDRCTERIRYPMREQITQTIASRLHGEKEENVLRRLKIEMIVDPLETSIIVLPLMDTLLQAACDAVSTNASVSAKRITDAILRRTMTIIDRLMELEKEAKPKPIDEKLAQRRKKVLESMLKKKTDTVSTQTSLAGIYEVKRRKESTEVICSICRQHSACEWCTGDQEGRGAPWQETKMLRTQDILLAYKPCYIVTKASEKQKDLKLACPPVTKVHPPPTPRTRTFKNSFSGKSSETIDILLQPEKVKPQESINEWSYILDATLMKPCSMKKSISDTSRTMAFSDQDCFSQNCLDTQAANALQILKTTFCNQETCIASSLRSLKETYLLNESDDSCMCLSDTINKILPQDTCCTAQTCKPYSKLHLPKTNSCNKNSTPQVPMRSRGDGFKIIPICISQTSNT